MQDTTSSIGAVWPPVISSNERIKGFYDRFIDDADSLDIFAGEFEEFEWEVGRTEQVGRLTVRALVAPNTLKLFEEQDFIIEGVLPLRDTEDAAILYLAFNDETRQLTPAELEAHQKLIAEVAGIVRAPHSNTDHLELLGLEPTVFTPKTPTATKAKKAELFTDLYGAFGYDEEEVSTLLLNPTNVIAFAEDKRGVVSTALAERAEVSVAGYGDITITEITEAVTRSDRRGLGIYRSISGYLVDQLLSSGDQLDVIYGECNLVMRGVVQAAHQNGRLFSLFDRDKYGVDQAGFGILQQNFKVEDGLGTKRYNDFALTYIPQT